MDIVDRAAVRVIGLELVVPFASLRTKVPAAWAAVEARAGDLPPPPWVEVSTDLGTGSYREVLGAQVPADHGVPDGMVAVYLAPARYVHEVHTGPADEIDVTFHRMLGFASQVGATPDGVRLDVGHGAGGPHALFVRLAATP